MDEIINFSLIEKYLIDEIFLGTPNIAKLAAEKFDLTVQTVNKYLNKLEKQGIIGSEGKTKGKKYFLIEKKYSYTVDIVPDTEESALWSAYISPHLKDFSLAKNVYDICNYGATEMLNNVIDHSQSEQLIINININIKRIKLEIIDLGIGIFEKIKIDFNLNDHLEAIQELVKGKLTSDPSRHSGEGIFFTSRMFDYFAIHSGSLSYVHNAEKSDWLFEYNKDNILGTSIIMLIKRDSQRLSKDVFAEFATDFAFNKTIIPVSLSQYGGDNLISRSQAKRILTRIEKFEEIVFDFKGIDMIGQAFADEIFRVFAISHPNIKLSCINANEDVHFMVNRALAAK